MVSGELVEEELVVVSDPDGEEFVVVVELEDWVEVVDVLVEDVVGVDETGGGGIYSSPGDGSHSCSKRRTAHEYWLKY